VRLGWILFLLVRAFLLSESWNRAMVYVVSSVTRVILSGTVTTTNAVLSIECSAILATR